METCGGLSPELEPMIGIVIIGSRWVHAGGEYRAPRTMWGRLEEAGGG